ncbi:MAG TPA: hypothetical protein VFN94_02265, partial [Nitrospiria bacterium]|nr:hypothetical protein [Nitrospiria bacterium]
MSGGLIEMRSVHFLARKAALLAVAMGIAAPGCGILTPGVKSVPIHEIDAHGISLDRARSLRAGDRAELVVAVLGEPADRARSCVPGEVIWRYPIRAWNDMVHRRDIVPAILLRITFNGSGTLTDWAFVDPLSGRPLAVRETQEEASIWFQSLVHAPPIPPRIEVNTTLLRGKTTQQDVERIFGQWQPHLLCGNGGPVPVVRKTVAAAGSVWDWYVDRPSPLFIP